MEELEQEICLIRKLKRGTITKEEYEHFADAALEEEVGLTKLWNNDPPIEPQLPESNEQDVLSPTNINKGDVQAPIIPRNPDLKKKRKKKKKKRLPKPVFMPHN